MELGEAVIGVVAEFVEGIVALFAGGPERDVIESQLNPSMRVGHARGSALSVFCP